MPKKVNYSSQFPYLAASIFLTEISIARTIGGARFVKINTPDGKITFGITSSNKPKICAVIKTNNKFNVEVYTTNSSNDKEYFLVNGRRYEIDGWKTFETPELHYKLLSDSKKCLDISSCTLKSPITAYENSSLTGKKVFIRKGTTVIDIGYETVSQSNEINYKQSLFYTTDELKCR